MLYCPEASNREEPLIDHMPYLKPYLPDSCFGLSSDIVGSWHSTELWNILHWGHFSNAKLLRIDKGWSSLKNRKETLTLSRLRTFLELSTQNALKQLIYEEQHFIMFLRTGQSALKSIHMFYTIGAPAKSCRHQPHWASISPSENSRTAIMLDSYAHWVAKFQS